MVYVNAYNGDDYQNWSQGETNGGREEVGEVRGGGGGNATNLSLWFMGGGGGVACRAAGATNERPRHDRSSWFETAKIEETLYETLGSPKGLADAKEYFRQGINAALRSIANAERFRDYMFVYLYTAHPDKHMHALGVEQEAEVERFWRVLGDRGALMSGREDVSDPPSNSDWPNPVDAAMIVTADHGHVTIRGDDMITLPKEIMDLLEYGCIGVHGKVSRTLQPRLWIARCDACQLKPRNVCFLFPCCNRANTDTCTAARAFNHSCANAGGPSWSYPTVFFCSRSRRRSRTVCLGQGACVWKCDLVLGTSLLFPSVGRRW